MQLPMADLMPDRVSVSALPVGILLGIQSPVDEDRAVVDPKRSEKVALPADDGNAEPFVQIIKVEAELKMTFENMFDRYRWGEWYVLGVSELRQQYIGLALEDLLSQVRNSVLHGPLASSACDATSLPS